MKKFNKRCSQARQDRFVMSLIGESGTYIEIGANHPLLMSNSYNLEVHGKYKGFSVELNTNFQQAWRECSERSNPVYWENALLFDYVSACKQNKMKKHVNYLSCDIEPPENTFNALKRVIGQGVTFDIITFEHDRYQSEENYHEKAFDFLKEYGYKIAVYDVWHKHPSRIFETWFVNSSIDFETKSFDEWYKEDNR